MLSIIIKYVTLLYFGTDVHIRDFNKKSYIIVHNIYELLHTYMFLKCTVEKVDDVYE